MAEATPIIQMQILTMLSHGEDMEEEAMQRELVFTAADIVVIIKSILSQQNN
jgi:hypothetical protein